MIRHVEQFREVAEGRARLALPRADDDRLPLGPRPFEARLDKCQQRLVRERERVLQHVEQDQRVGVKMGVCALNVSPLTRLEFA